MKRHGGAREGLTGERRGEVDLAGVEGGGDLADSAHAVCTRCADGAHALGAHAVGGHAPSMRRDCGEHAASSQPQLPDSSSVVPAVCSAACSSPPARPSTQPCRRLHCTRPVSRHSAGCSGGCPHSAHTTSACCRNRSWNSVGRQTRRGGGGSHPQRRTGASACAAEGAGCAPAPAGAVLTARTAGPAAAATSPVWAGRAACTACPAVAAASAHSCTAHQRRLSITSCRAGSAPATPRWCCTPPATPIARSRLPASATDAASALSS
eukprot:354474-Chlamydomonas_euryale.AAC.4